MYVPAVTNPIPLPRASLSFFSEAARGTRLQTALQVLQVYMTRNHKNFPGETAAHERRRPHAPRDRQTDRTDEPPRAAGPPQRAGTRSHAHSNSPPPQHSLPLDPLSLDSSPHSAATAAAHSRRRPKARLMPSACRISETAAICIATEMCCMTSGVNLRVDHVASASYSPCA